MKNKIFPCAGMQFLGHYGSASWLPKYFLWFSILICLDCVLYKNGFNLSKNEKVTAVVHELLGQFSYIQNEWYLIIFRPVCD